MGVFKKPEEKRSARVTVVMTQDMKKEFTAYCKSTDFTASEVLRDFILGRIKKYREKHA